MFYDKEFLVSFWIKFDEDNHSFTGVSTAEKNMRKKRKVFKTSIQLI